MAVRSLNKVLLIGNLTRDPEVKYTANGTAVCSFGLATNRSWKDTAGEIKEAVDFHNIIAWAKKAEVYSKLLSKGMKIFVEGAISTRSWEGEDGKTRTKTEIRADNLILLDSKGKSGAGMADTSDAKSPEALLEELESGQESEDVIDVDGASAKDNKDAEDPLADMPF